MRKFTWEEYYDKFYDWADSTQISYLSGLTSFGPADEVCEIAQAFFDERAASRLIRKAVAARVKFTANQVMDVSICLDTPALNEMAEAAVDQFNRKQLEELYGAVDDDVFECISKKSHIDINDDMGFSNDAVADLTEYEPEEFVVYETPKPGFFTKLLIGFGLMSSMTGPKKRNGKCSGDCAHCPPHYGYRYGRWYYGHNHTEGCRFGGNRGGGGRD